MKSTTVGSSQTQRVTVLLNSEKYIWTGSAWFDSRYIKPPATIIKQLNELLASRLAGEDDQIQDVYELTHRARIAREAEQFTRAEGLARRILSLEPEHHAAAAVLCACLRARGLAREAISQTDRFWRTTNTALLTSRAAAFCDLQQWREAKETIGQALAIQASEEAYMVVKRIKAARPQLYRA